MPWAEVLIILVGVVVVIAMLCSAEREPNDRYG
jgi:hypothetical protein